MACRLVGAPSGPALLLLPLLRLQLRLPPEGVLQLGARVLGVLR